MQQARGGWVAPRQPLGVHDVNAQRSPEPPRAKPLHVAYDVYRDMSVSPVQLPPGARGEMSVSPPPPSLPPRAESPAPQLPISSASPPEPSVDLTLGAGCGGLPPSWRDVLELVAAALPPPPADTGEAEETTTTPQTSVGLMLKPDPNHAGLGVVTGLVEGSAADLSGQIRVGDAVLQVDGTPFHLGGLARIRGGQEAVSAGTQMKLTLQRPGCGVLECVLVREPYSSVMIKRDLCFLLSCLQDSLRSLASLNHCEAGDPTQGPRQEDWGERRTHDLKLCEAIQDKCRELQGCHLSSLRLLRSELHELQGILLQVANCIKRGDSNGAEHSACHRTHQPLPGSGATEEGKICGNSTQDSTGLQLSGCDTGEGEQAEAERLQLALAAAKRDLWVSVIRRWLNTSCRRIIFAWAWLVREQKRRAHAGVTAASGWMFLRARDHLRAWQAYVDWKVFTRRAACGAGTKVLAHRFHAWGRSAAASVAATRAAALQKPSMAEYVTTLEQSTGMSPSDCCSSETECSSSRHAAERLRWEEEREREREQQAAERMLWEEERQHLSTELEALRAEIARGKEMLKEKEIGTESGARVVLEEGPCHSEFGASDDTEKVLRRAHELYQSSKKEVVQLRESLIKTRTSLSQSQVVTRALMHTCAWHYLTALSFLLLSGRSA